MRPSGLMSNMILRLAFGSLAMVVMMMVGGDHSDDDDDDDDSVKHPSAVLLY